MHLINVNFSSKEYKTNTYFIDVHWFFLISRYKIIDVYQKHHCEAVLNINMLQITFCNSDSGIISVTMIICGVISYVNSQ